MDLNIKLAEALVIKPGDRVLLLLRDYGWTQGHIEEARGFLEERFPDVTFGFISHVEGAVVEREELTGHEDFVVDRPSEVILPPPTAAAAVRAQVDQPRTPSGCDGEDSPEERAPIDMGYMSLPVETQRAIEIAAWSAAQDNPEEQR